jgi:hypothetical protein
MFNQRFCLLFVPATYVLPLRVGLLILLPSGTVISAMHALVLILCKYIRTDVSRIFSSVITSSPV